MVLEQEPDMVRGAGARYGPGSRSQIWSWEQEPDMVLGAGARYGPGSRSQIWSWEQELDMVLGAGAGCVLYRVFYTASVLAESYDFQV